MAGEVAAGAATAAAASNPWIGAASTVLGGALGASRQAGPSSADSIFSTNVAFDNSGWNLAFKGSTLDATNEKQLSQGGASGLSGNLNTYLPYALLFVGALIAYKAFKK